MNCSFGCVIEFIPQYNLILQDLNRVKGIFLIPVNWHKT